MLLKIGLAWASPGTQDVITFKSFSDVILNSGGWGLYHHKFSDVGRAFNYLPSMLHFVRSVRFLSDWTHWPFAFCLRLLSIVADAGSALVLWKIVEGRALKSNITTSPWAFLLYLIAPAAIWVSGFHGNTDAVMLFFLLLSLLLLQRQQAAWLVGVAFGMSLNIKLMPLIFVPLFLLFLETPRRRIEYSIVVAATVFCAGLPYFVQDPVFIWHRAFGYNGLYGTWGISHLLNLLSPELKTANLFFQQFGKFILLSSLLFYSVWLNRLPTKPDLLRQLALLMLLFFTVTPAFGAQYLAWAVPLGQCL